MIPDLDDSIGGIFRHKLVIESEDQNRSGNNKKMLLRMGSRDSMDSASFPWAHSADPSSACVESDR